MSSRSGLLATLLALVLAAPASAANLVVTSNADDGPGSLRAALVLANGTGEADQITFSGPLTINVGDSLDISSDVTITGVGSGPSGTVLDGGGAARVVMVSDNVTATLANLRVTGGQADSMGISDAGGAGIASESGSVLTLDRVLVDGNNVSGGGDYGGAVRTTDGTLTIVNSTIRANTIADTAVGANGAGVAVYAGATLSLTRSTVSGNSAATGGDGGGGGVYSDSTATITNSTITGNHAGTGGGGGIKAQGGTLTILNSTIAGNDAVTDGAADGGILTSVAVAIKNSVVSGNVELPATISNCAGGPFTDQGANVENGSTCAFGGGAGNPLLAALGDRGGLTQTLGLMAGSAAADRGGAGCPATDQRGVSRPQGASCDSGAFELAPATVTTGVASAIGETTATLTATITNPDAQGAVTDFQYGTTTSYGSTTPQTAIPAFAGATATTGALTGLLPGTTYHYRAVIANGAGTTFGADQTFTTASPAPGGTPPPGGMENPGGTGGPSSVTFGKPRVARDGRSVLLAVMCPEAGRLTGKITQRVKRKTKVLGRATRTVTAAGKVRFTVRLSKAGRRLLARKRTLKTRLRVAFKSASGATTTHSVAVTLKAKRLPAG